MTDRELMQQALEALLWEYGWGDPKKPQLAAITALRERLAQPDQWQGLTDEEIKTPIQRAMQHFGYDPTQYSLGGLSTIGFYGLVKDIEARLKEKNG